MAGIHDATIARLNDGAPDWLTARRQAGLAAWAGRAMPTGSSEEWRYVDLDFTLDDYRPADRAGDALDPDDFAGAVTRRAATAILVDGCVMDVAGELAGVGPVDEMDHLPGIVERYGSLVSAGQSIFAAAHQALAPAGLVVAIPKGAAVEGDIVVDLQAVTDGSVSFPHVTVVLEENSEASVVVIARSAPGIDALHVPLVEAFVGDGARLRFTAVQNHDRGVRAVANHAVSLGRDASVDIGEVGLGGAYGRQRLALGLDGAGASARMNGIYFGDGDQVLDYRVFVTHRGPRTTSDIFLKGAVEDTAQAVWTGLVRIEQEAVGTSAFETNRNLVLSDGARVNSVPNLEILTDDLQCGHGSSSGPLEEDHLYYLMSRGLPRDRAERLLVRGFFEEIIGELPAADLAGPTRIAVNAKYEVAQLEGRV